MFASSTNFIETLTLGAGEATFISTLKSTAPWDDQLEVTIFQNNKISTVPFGVPTRTMQALAGPMQLQFQDHNVFMEHQRIQTTNLHTVIFDNTNGVTLDVAAGRTINFFTPTRWFFQNGRDNPYPHVLVTISNSVTIVKNTLYGGETFTGPLRITLLPGSPALGNTFTDGWISYYFTEGFTTIPSMDVTRIPAGKAQVLIEKSRDLTNWGAVFLNSIADDQSGFYRLKISK